MKYPNYFVKTMLFLCCMMLWHVKAYACGVAPPETVEHYVKLINRNSSIVLAKLEKSEKLDYGIVYTFNVIEAIKGRFKNNEVIVESNYRVNGYNSDFMMHKDPRFWDGVVSRGVVSPDCTVSVSFKKGDTYLLFLDKPYHVKGFERIINLESDIWLKTVKNVVNQGALKGRYSLSFLDYLKEHKAVYLAQCSTDKRKGIKFENLIHLYGQKIGGSINSVDFGNQSYGQAGCRSRGQLLLSVFYDDINMVKGYPILGKKIDISHHDTEIYIKGEDNLDLFDILSKIKGSEHLNGKPVL